MAGALLILAGVACMAAGAVLLGGWIAGKSRWFGVGVYDRAGESKADRQVLYLYFIVLVLAPLLGGALLIAFGIQQLQT